MAGQSRVGRGAIRGIADLDPDTKVIWFGGEPLAEAQAEVILRKLHGELR